VPWAKGRYPADQKFALATADGKDIPVQTWATAKWPDGSLKWTARAVAVQGVPGCQAAAVRSPQTATAGSPSRLTAMSGRPPGSRPDRATCQSKASSASAAHHSREIRQPLRNASRTSAANSRIPPVSPAR
ncbi:hypothetical protein EAO72_06885, partial [Streptomyces sp. or43]